MNRDEIYNLAEQVWGAGEVYIGPGIENLMYFAQLVAVAGQEKLHQFEANHFSNARLKVDPVTGSVSIGTPPRMTFDGSAPLVVMPQPAFAKREWVGLTKDEVNAWELPNTPTVFEFAQFIEAKLKEKNT